MTIGYTERFEQLFSHSETRRSPYDIAIRLQGAILRGSLRLGERRLCVLFGVGRARLREALRILQANDLIEIRRGVKGGAYVRGPSPDRAGSVFTWLIQLQGATSDDFADFRLLFEPETARLAAVRATSVQIAALMETAAQIGAMSDLQVPWDDFMELDIVFHTQVAEASGNAIRVAVMRGVHGAFREPPLRPKDATRRRGDSSSARRCWRLHGAVRSHRAQAAEAAMREHLVSNVDVAQAMLEPAPVP